ncbi:UNVERIFIED_CONTAM: hypothetical protein HDU68_003104 [Siphonaria sp. JEL0065]|nr:hypothetical protein HDU68_003104 [Siphonaria sp. JEL0065]
MTNTFIHRWLTAIYHVGIFAFLLQLSVFASVVLGYSEYTFRNGMKGNCMPRNTYLSAGTYIPSPNGQYSVHMQTDGNLVTYHGNAPMWASASNGGSYLSGPADNLRFVYQTDSNLVVYNGQTALWAASWNAHSPYGQQSSYLCIQDDGNYVLYAIRKPADGPVIETAIWATSWY